MYVQGLANFLDDLMGGLELVSLSILVGSLFWGALVLRVWRPDSAAPATAWHGCMRVLRAGALALAVTQALKILTKAAVLASALGELPLTVYAGTVQFQAGAIRIGVAAAILWSTRGWHERPTSRPRWVAAIGLTAMLLIAGAWLVHGVGRLEHRGTLMALTVAHQLAAAVWVGGVVQLLWLWHIGRTDDRAREFWPLGVTRFSALGMASVAALLATGMVLAWQYVGSLDGLVGTGYGSLVAAKVFLLGVTLGFAYLNFRAGRDWLHDRNARAVVTGVPCHVEAETFLLVGILFLAATVSSQPPAIDIPGLTASVSELLEMFTPRLPALSSPTHEALLAGQAASVALVGRIPSAAGSQWSDYNHNVSGIFLIGMSVLALLSYRPGFAWARYWPLGFVALSVFLFFRSDAEAWPLGPVGFWRSTFGDGEVLQHRIATLLAFALGALETSARAGKQASERLQAVFPVLCAFGGVLLVTHAHTAFEIKSQYLIQSTHLAMGLLAIVMATGRWLELRLTKTGNAMEARFSGLVAVGAMLMIGAILAIYREPLG